MKLQTKGGKWTVTDKGKTKEFSSSRDAWDYIFMMLQIRSAQPSKRKELHPVLSLIPPKKKVLVSVDA